MLNPSPDIAHFASNVTAWQAKCGRHDLPWQNTRDPYRIWLSEIMLQQTQVATVIGYYERFLARFPDVKSLADAAQDDVMPYWAGLGYYARARNLHKCAGIVAGRWGGRFPKNIDDIASLPGIGRSTAAAITAFAFGQRNPIMDGNVKRVFTRYFGIEGEPQRRAVEQQLWFLAQEVIARSAHGIDMAAYTQGLMDLGATVCTRRLPQCGACPLSSACYARRAGRQGELPTPKARKAAPKRHCQMLVVHDDDHVLLVRQPSPGIWGGLWSLPKYDDVAAMHAAMQNMGLAPGTESPLEPFTHVFSHFALRVEPWIANARGMAAAEPRPAQSWKGIHALAAVALPAPIKALLDRLF
jgi:A/G-specific adenine glycosylase